VSVELRSRVFVDFIIANGPYWSHKEDGPICSL
jgi:hypothetical protein